jgi:hypothetical protein
VASINEISWLYEDLGRGPEVVCRHSGEATGGSKGPRIGERPV